MLVWLLETETGDLSEVNLRDLKIILRNDADTSAYQKHHFYLKRALSNAKSADYRYQPLLK